MCLLEQEACQPFLWLEVGCLYKEAMHGQGSQSATKHNMDRKKNGGLLTFSLPCCLLVYSGLYSQVTKRNLMEGLKKKKRKDKSPPPSLPPS